MKQEIPEYVKQRLEKLQSQLADAEATLKATSPVDPLLVEIAHSLQLAELVCNPQASLPFDRQKVSGSKTQPEPGANVRGARRATRILRKNLEDAIRRFHIAAEHDWNPPRPPKDPMRRCRNRKCEAVDKRIPKWVGPRGSRIELVNCPKCEWKLGEA